MGCGDGPSSVHTCSCSGCSTLKHNQRAGSCSWWTVTPLGHAHPPHSTRVLEPAWCGLELIRFDYSDSPKYYSVLSIFQKISSSTVAGSGTGSEKEEQRVVDLAWLAVTRQQELV